MLMKHTDEQSNQKISRETMNIVYHMQGICVSCLNAAFILPPYLLFPSIFRSLFISFSDDKMFFYFSNEVGSRLTCFLLGNQTTYCSTAQRIFVILPNPYPQLISDLKNQGKCWLCGGSIFTSDHGSVTNILVSIKKELSK